MFRTISCVLWLAVPALAFADGTLQIEKNSLLPAHVWVDGQPMGKVKGRTPIIQTLPAGPHEVWVAGDPDGTVTLCHGLIDVADGAYSTATILGAHCDNLRDGVPTAGTAFKGATVNFRLQGVSAWVSIDGRPSLALPQAPFELNLTPGPHTIVLYDDVAATTVHAQGMITLASGDALPVTCTPGGCLGFDQPTVVVQQIR